MTACKLTLEKNKIIVQLIIAAIIVLYGTELKVTDGRWQTRGVSPARMETIFPRVGMHIRDWALFVCGGSLFFFFFKLSVRGPLQLSVRNPFSRVVCRNATPIRESKSLLRKQQAGAGRSLREAAVRRKITKMHSNNEPLNIQAQHRPIKVANP